jgi:TPR repeat protein
LGLSHFPPDETDLGALERACALGDAPGCHHLALALELPGARHDARRAADLHAKSCGWSWGPACVRLGTLLAGGEVMAVEPERAARAYRDACELGAPAGCFELGVLRQEGTRVVGNPDEGAKLLERACRNGEGRACARMATRALTGRDGERDPERARALFEQACGLGNARACLELSGDAGLERARAAAVPACETALTLCRDGKTVGVERTWKEWDGAPARVLVHAPGCDERLEHACVDAADALSLSCKRLRGEHCFVGARLFERLSRAGLGPDRAQVEELRKLGIEGAKQRCEQNQAAACAELAELHRDDADLRTFERYLARACKLDPAYCD